MNLDETNIHTLLTQIVAVIVVVIGLIHPDSKSITIPDAVLVSVATLAASIASGLHALKSKPTVEKVGSVK